MRQLAALLIRKSLSAWQLLPDPEPDSSSEDLCKTQAVLVHLLWAPSVASVYSLHWRRSWGLSSAAQITAGIIHSIQLDCLWSEAWQMPHLVLLLVLMWRHRTLSFLRPCFHCPSLTSSHNPKGLCLFRGLGERLHLPIVGLLFWTSQGLCCQVFMGNAKQFPLFCNAVIADGTWICCLMCISIVTNTKPALVMGFRR